MSTLIGIDITADRVVNMMFCSFKKSCLPREVKPLEWNLSLALKNLTCPLYELIKLVSDKHLTGGNLFPFSSSFDQEVSELHGLTY